MSQKSQENTCARVSFLKKLQDSTCNYIKKETQVLSRDFCEIFKNTFFTDHVRTTASDSEIVHQSFPSEMCQSFSGFCAVLKFLSHKYQKNTQLSARIACTLNDLMKTVSSCCRESRCSDQFTRFTGNHFGSQNLQGIWRKHIFVSLFFFFFVGKFSLQFFIHEKYRGIEQLFIEILLLYHLIS